MAAQNRQRALHSRIAALNRWHGSDHPDVATAQRDLRAVLAEDYIRKIVDEAPPLTEDQRSRLAAILQSGEVKNAS